MKEIYTKAALRKCSKPKALDKLKDIYISLSDEDKRINLDAFADLFSFFTPKPAGKKEKTPLEWVNLAVSTEATRYYLCASYSDGEWLVATDGHRLHRIKTDLPEGYYDKLGNAIDLDGTFSEYTRLFFETKDKLEVILDVEKAELEHHGKKWYYVFNVKGQEWGVNKKYFDDALNGKKVLKGHFDINIKPKKDDKVVDLASIYFMPFQSEDKTLMLMPVKLHNVRNK